jgi:hypothetical protein
LHNNFFYYQNVSADYIFLIEFYDTARRARDVQLLFYGKKPRAWFLALRHLCQLHLRNSLSAAFARHQVLPLCIGKWTLLHLPVASSLAKVFGGSSSPFAEALTFEYGI